MHNACKTTSIPNHMTVASFSMEIWTFEFREISTFLNSCDSFLRRKFENRTATSCRSGPILSPPTISFELHTKMAEEINLEKCIFCNFGSSFTLTLDRVKVILMCISGRDLPIHQIRSKSDKLFVDVRMDVQTDGHT